MKRIYLVCLTIALSIRFVFGQTHQTLTLDGVDDYIDLEPWAKQINQLMTPNGTYTGDCTYEFWLKTPISYTQLQSVWVLGNNNPTPSINNVNAENTFIGNLLAVGNGFGGYEGELIGFGNIRKIYSPVSGSYNSFGAYYQTNIQQIQFINVWHHYALVYYLDTLNSNSKKYNFFIDGVLQNTGIVSINGDVNDNTHHIIIPNGEPEINRANIGLRVINNMSLPLKGEMYNFRIWNKAFGTSGINQLKNTDYINPQQNLILNLRFNELENISTYPNEYISWNDTICNEYRDYSINQFHGKLKNSNTNSCDSSNTLNNLENVNNSDFIFKELGNKLYFIDFNSNKDIENAKIIVFDISGKMILNKKINEHRTYLNLTFLNKGMYFINIINGNVKYSLKTSITY